MTVLSRIGRDKRDDLVSIQCDLCVPPVLSASTERAMRRLGWLLVVDGHRFDVCPSCSLTRPARARSPRRDDEPVAGDAHRLPNLIVIGAAKAGTTSLHTYLDLHPEIAMSLVKEMRFFTDPEGPAWLGQYQASFPAGTRYRGESTPQYTKWPLFPGVVDRIFEQTPLARLIYLVRDPVERALAEYVEEATWGVMSEDIEDELEDAEAGHNRLIAPSRYATQLREFHRRFDSAQIMVVDLDDMAEDPAKALTRIFGFLGLAPVDLEQSALRPQNTWGSKGIHPRWYRALRRPLLIRAAHRMPTRHLTAVQTFVARRISRPVARPRPSDATVGRLRALLAPEIAELRELTGLEFKNWSV